MPFPFSYLCDLLDELEQPFLREAGCLPAPLREYLRTHTSKWFILHRTRLDAVSTNTRAVLSMLRPHQQTDRAYGIAPEDLELVVARALQLSRLQYSDLQKWRTDLLKRDLAFFVQQVMEDSKEVSRNSDEYQNF
jgi:DNA ligase-4